MNANQRFSMSIHILTLLAAMEKPLTSEEIAHSVDTNPVVIRRVMAHLRRNKLVESKPGSSGGWKLLRAPNKINLREIYQMVNDEDVLSMHTHPNKRCPIGKEIQQSLKVIFDDAQTALELSLNKVTVADVLNDVMQNQQEIL